MYQTLSKQELNAMTSDSYKAAFEGPEGDSFRKRVAELENQPVQTGRPRGSVRGEEVAPNPAQTFANDPSWADVDEQPAPVVAPAPAPAAQPVAAVVTNFSQLPELTHEYQPEIKDKATGKVTQIGSKQVFRYRTVNDPADQNSLVRQLQQAHAYASVKIRQLSRDRKLGEITDAGVTTTKVPRPTDVVPATPEELAKELRAVRESNYALSIRVAANTFLENCQEYATRYRTQANNESLILAIHRANDDETDPEAYMRAFTKMRGVMEPIAAEPTSVVVAVPAPAPAPVAAAPATPAVPAVRATNTPRLATGLSNADSTSSNDPFEAVPEKVAGVRLLIDGKTQVMDFRSWDRLSSDSQKKILRNGANATAINALYDAENERRAAARSAR